MRKNARCTLLASFLANGESLELPPQVPGEPASEEAPDRVRAGIPRRLGRAPGFYLPVGRRLRPQAGRKSRTRSVSDDVQGRDLRDQPGGVGAGVELAQRRFTAR